MTTAEIQQELAQLDQRLDEILAEVDQIERRKEELIQIYGKDRA